MSLTPGQSLLHYELIEQIGAGGMGVVFSAMDSKLRREVAIKVLPDDVANDRERLVRFEREAHALASLNHPGIASIHGFEESGGVHFLVMELVKGETLSERLSRGPMSVDETLSTAKQIAAALEEAHLHGIIHRDLKPANIKLTPDGQVRVLDFGLAKVFERDATEPGDLTMSPTVTAGGTLAGTILGTASYMSPEQSRGEPVDRRSDVWAFGTVVWEMLTGHVLFGGTTVTDVIAAVVRQEVDPDALPSATPRPLRRLLVRCLRKDLTRRLPDIGTARMVIEDILSGETDEVMSTTERKSRTLPGIGGAVVALALVTLAIFAAIRWTQSPESRSPVRFHVEPPEGWSLVSSAPVPSPDGLRIAFIARSDGGTEQREQMLWIRDLATEGARLLPETNGVRVVLWSPDGEHLFFFDDKHLRRLHLRNESLQTMCTLPGTSVYIYGASWQPPNSIVYSANGELYSVSATGGTPTRLAGQENDGMDRVLPQFVGNDDAFLFLGRSRESQTVNLYMASLKRPGHAEVIRQGLVKRTFVRDHLLFVEDGILFAGPFDAQRGVPVAIAAGISQSSWYPGIGYFGVSPRTLAYIGAKKDLRVQFAWYDRSGSSLTTIGEPARYEQVALSPDLRTIAFEVRENDQFDVWLMDVARGVTTRLTLSDQDERDPTWSPDSQVVSYTVYGPDGPTIERKSVHSNAVEERWPGAPSGAIAEHWCLDGQALLIHRKVEGRSTIQLLDLTGQQELVVDSAFPLDEPQLSPDSRWLAYISHESGRAEVYLEPFRREGQRLRVSVDGGGQPRWRSDGRELFFVDSAGHLVSVDFEEVDGSARISLPTVLFMFPGDVGAGVDDFAVTPDGERFLVKVPLDPAKARLHVVTDWLSLLEE